MSRDCTKKYNRSSLPCSHQLIKVYKIKHLNHKGRFVNDDQENEDNCLCYLIIKDKFV